MNCLEEVYALAKSHDLPNWVILFFTVLLWPIVLYFWNKRKRSHVKNLKISLSKDVININGNNIDAVRLTVTNSTTSTVFLTNLRLRNKADNFKIHKDSARDFISGYYELKFFNPATQLYSIRDAVFYTDKENFTPIGIDGNLDDRIFTYKANWFQRLFKCYKYFILEYTVLVGEKRYLVKTRY